MRIGIDACCWANRRGFGRFTRELLTALVATEQDNSYLFFADQETASQSTFPPGVEVVTAQTDVTPMQAASAAGRRSLRDVWALTKQVKRHDIDLFFFPAVYSYFPILNRTKIIVTIHDMIADHHPDAVFPDLKLKLFWKLKQQMALRQSDLILTVSEYSKGQIREYFKLPEKRIRAISEGPSHAFTVVSDGAEMTEILNRYGLEGNRFALYVGGISPHKNLKALVEACGELMAESEFPDLKLVLVGDYKDDSFHSDYPALKAQVAQRGLDNRVIFTGFIPDEELVYLYNAASVFVLPSFEEGFGLPIVEAMACGTPVVASNRGSIPEILGDAGPFFDPYQVATMVAALRPVLADEGLRNQMKAKSLQRSRQFMWDVVARQTLSIFEQVVGKK